ncbi:m3G-cap-specific nuclear import receptor [Klebsormidium nitens]|uniref:Snurportin-1 n=1 Tax=Klebsormidium nitens TaxID=105231 RepID=A0A1Y1HSW3_KLENI|nr:m3G-cap-specific nuclear import receptor [Klebsormidium nitens]|eukprot:GAQ80912.1 m3G-cap-specific nuclear import receptor [Klebsormidium nitens]
METVPARPDGRPPRSYKGSSRPDQQKRRELALARQREARKELQAHARRLSQVLTEEAEFNDGTQEDLMYLEAETATDESSFRQGTTGQEPAESSGIPPGDSLRGQISPGDSVRGQQLREWYARQLLQPEWMIDVPPDLATNWSVMARPEGKRCLVISANGSTVSRLKNGRILHTFPSFLPNGARVKGIAQACHVYCILDCIFHEPDQTYYVIDMMCWKGYPLYDCASSFRLFWIATKLPETDAFRPPAHYHRFRFAPVQVYDADPGGIHLAYAGEVPYQRDGLLFYNKEAHYSLGVTPLVLLWKDPLCSNYFLDTDSKGTIPTEQQVVLRLRADGTVASSDDPPVVLGSIPAAFLQQHAESLRPGTLLRFSVGDRGIQTEGDGPPVADLQYQGLANQRRGGPDSFTKILFQYAARHDPLTIEQIL